MYPLIRRELDKKLTLKGTQAKESSKKAAYLQHILWHTPACLLSTQVLRMRRDAVNQKLVLLYRDFESGNQCPCGQLNRFLKCIIILTKSFILILDHNIDSKSSYYLNLYDYH